MFYHTYIVQHSCYITSTLLITDVVSHIVLYFPDVVPHINCFVFPRCCTTHCFVFPRCCTTHCFVFPRCCTTHCFVFITDEDDDSGEVMKYLKTAAGDWQTVSRYLHVKASRIREFCSNYGHDSGRCLDSAVADWLSWNYNTEKYGKPTWKKVAQSVVNVNRKLFLAIASEHSVEGEQCLYIKLLCAMIKCADYFTAEYRINTRNRLGLVH